MGLSTNTRYLALFVLVQEYRMHSISLVDSLCWDSTSGSPGSRFWQALMFFKGFGCFQSTDVPPQSYIVFV